MVVERRIIEQYTESREAHGLIWIARTTYYIEIEQDKVSLIYDHDTDWGEWGYLELVLVPSENRVMIKDSNGVKTDRVLWPNNFKKLYKKALKTKNAAEFWDLVELVEGSTWC